MKNKIIAFTLAAILIVFALVLAFATIGHEIIALFIAGVGLVIIVFALLGILAKSHRLAAAWLRGVVSSVLIIGTVGFAALEIMVVTGAKVSEDAEAPYLIVLGAKVNGSAPSLILSERLRAALDYMTEYPDSTAIVSGGQGAGENISEAEAMEVWLVNKGVDGERIIKEDKSTTTQENLENSLEIIKNMTDSDEIRAAIVTSDFHMYRAVYMAEKLGITAVSFPARTARTGLRVNYYMREPIALVKMYLFQTASNR